MPAPRPAANRPCWPLSFGDDPSPSVIFGPRGPITHRFGSWLRVFSVPPPIGGGVTKLQLAYVGDVATAVANAVDGGDKGRR